MNQKWPAPTRADHQQFCQSEGWEEVRNARGSKGSHHVTYEKALSDGRILRTRVSHPPNRETYGHTLWSHILRDQLQVDEAEFWACVQNGQLPDRGGTTTEREALPTALVSLLIHTVGLSDAQVALMTKDEAVARVNELWTTGR